MSITSPIIAGLMQADAWPHPVDELELIETHISWVILTGPFAYKLKKPLNLGFLDYSTLEKRRAFCEKELELNQRLAPELYLGVVPVSGPEQKPRMGGDGEAVEYALKMKQFDQSGLLDQQLARDQVSVEDMDALAGTIADFHGRIEVAQPNQPWGTAAHIKGDAADNFLQISHNVSDEQILDQLDDLEEWNENRLETLGDTFMHRHNAGFVRECHGDLHLTNLVRLKDAIVPFDCIEFSEGIRFVDVINEVAFLAMDLMVRDRTDLAYRFVNAWLSATGDYAGVRLLRFYIIYRSLVRAKVAAIRHAQDSGAQVYLDKVTDHVDLAHRMTLNGPPLLGITHGLSGSGKTWLSDQLIPALPCFRVRSDVERKRLFGESGPVAPGSGIYSKQHTENTYARLEQVARDVLSDGWSLIVDAAFLKRPERDRFHDLAEGLGVGFAIIDCQAPESVLRARIERRATEAKDASDADLRVLDFQLANAHAIDWAIADDERSYCVTIETGGDPDIPALAEQLRANA